MSWPSSAATDGSAAPAPPPSEAPPPGPRGGRWRDHLQRALASRRAPAVIILFALCLAAPSLGSGLAADDWFHALVLRGEPILEGIHDRPLDLFVFSTGGEEVGRAQQRSGIIGWWADPTTKIAYFRPLSALTHWLDHTLWPDATWAMHAHSLAWFAAALALLARLYRRLLAPPWIAGLALLLYAIDDAHGFALSWIANRNALVALTFAVAAILLHDGWRRGKQTWAAPGSLLALLAALGGGESAVAAGAYLFAYALFIDPGGRRRGLLSLIPAAAVIVTWRLAYNLLGYGAEGSGLSIDPGRQPLEFLAAAAVRLPVLLLAQLALPMSDLWEFYPIIRSWLQPAILAWALLVLSVLLTIFSPLLRREPVARFWALGMVLGALPACAQVPHDRLLLLAGVGAMPLVARFLAAVLDNDAAVLGPILRRRSARLIGIALAGIHLVFPLWALPLRVQGAADVTRMLDRADRTVPQSPDVTERTVVLVNPPADAFAGYLPMRRAVEGRPRPRSLRWLATGASELQIDRLDAQTLRVTPESGFLSLKSEWMQRSPDRPMPLGHEVDLDDVVIRISTLTRDGRPAQIEARFRVPLDDPSLVWLHWTRDGFAPFVPPPVGASKTLPAIDFLAL